jgi:hypothetical protein
VELERFHVRMEEFEWVTYNKQSYASPRMGIVHRLFCKFQLRSFKQNQLNDTKINPPLFSLVNTFKTKCKFIFLLHQFNKTMYSGMGGEG